MNPVLKKKMDEQAIAVSNNSDFDSDTIAGFTAGATWMFEEMEKMGQGAREFWATKLIGSEDGMFLMGTKERQDVILNCAFDGNEILKVREVKE